MLKITKITASEGRNKSKAGHMLMKGYLNKVVALII
jgi:hypothetical protein